MPEEVQQCWLSDGWPCGRAMAGFATLALLLLKGKRQHDTGVQVQTICG